MADTLIPPPSGPASPLAWTRADVVARPKPVRSGRQVMARDFYHGYMLGRPILQDAPPTMLPGQYPRQGATIHHLGIPLHNVNSDASYWTGPTITINPVLTGDAAKTALAQVQQFGSALRKSFNPRNFVKECVRRHVDAVIGKDPEWHISGVTKEQKAWLEGWWKASKAHAAVIAALDQAKVEDRSVLLLRLKEGAVRPGVTLTAEKLARALVLEPVPPEDAYFGDDDKADPYAILFTAGQTAELYALNDDGLTVRRVFRANVREGEKEYDEVKVKMGGRLLMREVRLSPIADDAFLASNRAYNVAKTMIDRNTELAGVVERYAINLEPPMVEGPDGKQVPLLNVGSGAMSAWFSRVVEAESADGTVKPMALPSPEYGRIEPVSAEPILAALERNELDILNAAQQVHVLQNQNSTTRSGRSQEVSAGDYMSSLDPTTREAQDIVEWVLESVLALRAHFLGEAITPQVTVFARVQPVPPTVAERAQMMSETQWGIISVQFYRAKIGVLNSGSMTEQINDERKAGFSPTLLNEKKLSKPDNADAVLNKDPSREMENARRDGNNPTKPIDAPGGAGNAPAPGT